MNKSSQPGFFLLYTEITIYTLYTTRIFNIHLHEFTYLFSTVKNSSETFKDIVMKKYFLLPIPAFLLKNILPVLTEIPESNFSNINWFKTYRKFEKLMIC